ncbi:MAG TPA: 4-alpha-glucanotransferase [Gemmatimonadaceae bacterium]|nr:4-alpha-glucanotransferase [Gemmatimonadaceae bacterium]
MPHDTSALRTLARHAGIVESYVEQSGREVRHASDDTREALLCAMGLDAGDERSAARTLEDWRARDAAELMPPARVVRGPERAREIVVRVPFPRTGAVGWQIAQNMPGGEDAERTGRDAPDENGILRLRLPIEPEPGYHRIRVRLHAGSHHPVAEQMLIVAPRTCPSPRARLPRPVFGLTANLYAVRSGRNWGAGDLTDLSALIQWMAGHGAAFVGVNPLHALRNVNGDISPYRPVSRIYRNPLYLDVEAVPELAESPDAQRLLADPLTRTAIAECRGSRWLDYDRVWSLKTAALEALYATFRERHLSTDSPRARAYREFAAREGTALEDHATFLALEEALRGRGHQGSWHGWPVDFKDARSPAVLEFRERHAERVDWHRWLQFEIERQVARAGHAARESGMRIGLYQDLAIGCSPDGSDAWAHQDLLITGANLGAPPDQYSATGQNWGLPPLNPHTLLANRYEYWIALVRAALRHCGALRIDHILGLFRQFWIPEGKTGIHGAYVQFPTEDLLGILALEASRTGALIVGEDLGTVPPEVPPTLRDWEILGTKVMYFEREGEAGFRPARDYDELALTVADTHDMVPLAGFWNGRDIEIRRATGLLSDEAAERARELRVAERDALAERLRAEGGLRGDAPEAHDIVRSAHGFLCATPSRMVSLSLEDVALETEPVNVPGVDHQAYPSWTRRLTTTLEALADDTAATARVDACRPRADA